MRFTQNEGLPHVKSEDRKHYTCGLCLLIFQFDYFDLINNFLAIANKLLSTDGISR